MPATAARPRASLTVLYATESGNAESLAIKAKKAAQKHGLDARVIDMADADMGTLAKTKNLIVYAATWGEGEPPGRATDFYHALMSAAAPRLDGVQFAVLALGDTSYTQFCATGKAIDARLEALGASRAADPHRSRSRLREAGRRVDAGRAHQAGPGRCTVAVGDDRGAGRLQELCAIGE